MLVNALLFLALSATSLAAPALTQHNARELAIRAESTTIMPPSDGSKIGMNGQDKRTLDLSELIYYGNWEDEEGCNNVSRRSDGSATFEAFAGVFDDDVVGAIVSRSLSSRESIIIGTGRVWSLSPSTDSVDGCELSHVIAFTGPRIAPIPGTLFPSRHPLSGKRAFSYIRVNMDTVSVQRQWLQADKVTIYSTYQGLMADTQGYDLDEYYGGIM